MGGGRWKAQWRNRAGLRIDNTLSFSVLEQGGYPYAYVGEDIVRDGKTVIRNGQVSYNDPSSYRRAQRSATGSRCATTPRNIPSRRSPRTSTPTTR